MTAAAFSTASAIASNVDLIAACARHLSTPESYMTATPLEAEVFYLDGPIGRRS